ncbi:MAG: hypothetical protein RLY16_17, partial [Bacteroidota bacterium]
MLLSNHTAVEKQLKKNGKIASPPDDQVWLSESNPYKLLFENTPIPLLCFSKQKDTIQLNKLASDTFQLDFSTMALKDFLIFFDASSQTLISNFLSKTSIQATDFIILHPATENNKVFESVKLNLLVADSSIQILSVELQSASVNLRPYSLQNETIHFEALFNNAQDAIILADDDRNIIDANPAAALLLKYTKEELLQLKADDLIFNVSADEFNGHWQKLLSDGLLENNVLLQTKNHQRVIAHFRASTNILPGIHLAIVRDITEKFKQQKALDQAFIKLDALVRNTTDVNILFNEKKEVVSFNQAGNILLNTYFGTPLLEGIDLYNFIKNKDRHSRFDTHFHAALKGDTVRFELEWPTPNNQSNWWEITFSPANNHLQQIVGVVVNAKEITENKRAIFSLKKSEANYAQSSHLLQSILDSPKGIVIFSLDRNYCYQAYTSSHQQTMKKIWGVDIAIGMNMLDCITNEKDRVKAKAHFDRALNGEHVQFLEEYGDVNLSRQFWENKYAPIYSAANEVIGITVYVMDVSEGHRNAEIVRDSEAKYRSLLDRAFDGVLIYTPLGKILEFNEKAYRFLGYNHDEFSKLSITDLFFQEDLKQVPIDFEKLKNQSSVIDYRRLRKKNGDGIEMEINSTLLNDGSILVFGRDITERKRHQHRDKTRTHILEMLSRGAEFKVILNEIVIGAEKVEPGLIGSILILNRETRKFVKGAAPSLPDFYNTAIEQYEIGDGVGACGTAAALGKRVIIEDISIHPYFNGFTELCAQAGLGSCWSEPIFDEEGNVLGTFAIYHAKPTKPTQHDLDYIKELSDITSIVFNKHFADHELQSANSKLQEVSEMAKVGGFDFNFKTGKITWTDVTRSIYEVPDDFELKIESVQQFHDEDYNKTVMDKLMKHFSLSHEPFVLEVKISSYKGNEKWVREKCRAEFENDKLIRIFGSKQDITDKKHAEILLQQSESRFRSMIYNISDVISLLDSTGKITYMSRSVKELLGYEEGELKGINIFEYIHEDDLVVIKEHLKENIINGGVSPMLEFRFKHKNGHFIQLEAQGNNQLQNETIKGIIVVSRDITERKKAQALLLARENYFKTLIKHSSSAIILLNEQGQFVYQSPIVQKILGYPIYPEVVRNFTELVHPDDFGAIVEQFKNVIQTPEHTERGIYRFRHHDGHYVWLEGTATNMLHDETIKAVIGNYQEVTERKIAEERISNERKLLKTLIDNIPDLIYVKDTEGKKLIANRADVQFMGLQTEEEAIGKTDLEIYPGKMGERGHQNDLNVMFNGEIIHAKEDQYLDNNGCQRWLLVSKLPLRNSENEVFGMLGIARDITARKESEEALIKSNERFDLASKATFDAIWDWDLVQKTFFWSEGYQILFGHPINECCDINDYHQFQHVDDKARIQQSIQDVLNSEQSNWFNEYRFVKADGTVAYVQDRAFIVRNKKGQAIRMIGAMQDITLQKEKSIELQETEKRFRALVENSSDGTAILDCNGNVSYISPSIYKILGYTEEEALHLNLFDYTHPDDQDGVAASFEQCLNSPGIPINGYTSRTLHKNGSWRWLEDTTTNLLHVPSVNGFVVNFRDVTERLEIEKTVLNEKLLLDYIINSLPGIFYMYTPEGKFLRWNKNFELVTGFSAEEIAIMKPHDFYDDGGNGWLDERISNVIAGSQKSLEVNLRRKDNSFVPLYITSRFIQTESVRAITGVGFDISERLKQEDELKASNERFEFAMEATNDYIWDWDLRKGELNWSSNYTKYFGYDTSDPMKNELDWKRHIHPEDVDRVYKSIYDVINGTEKNWLEEYRYQKSNGEYAVVVDKGVMVRDQNGIGTRMIGAMQDITYRVKAQEQLKLFESV